MALWDNLIDYSYADNGDLSSWDTPSTYSPVPQDLGYGGAFGIGDLLASLPAFGGSVPVVAATPSAVNQMDPQQLAALLNSGSGSGGNGLLSLLGAGGGSEGGFNPLGSLGGLRGLQGTLQNTLGVGGGYAGPLAGAESIGQGIFQDLFGGGPPGGSDIFGFSSNPIDSLFGFGPGSTGGDILGGGATGAEIGSFFGPIGTLIGGGLGLLGGGIESLFGGGRPHTQATQQSAQTLQGQGDPVEQYLGRIIGGAAGNNRVLSESNGARSLEAESGTLADVLQILGNYTLPGLGGSLGFQLPGAPSVGVLPLGRSYGGLSEPSALSPAAYQQKFGFSQPTSQDLSAFLSSPYAPTAAQGAGGQAGALSSVLGDYRSFLASGGGGGGNASATNAANAGLGSSAFVPSTGATAIGGGGDLAQLMQLLGSGPGGSSNLMATIQKAIQSAISNQGQAQQPAQQRPLPWQPGGTDPWHLGMDI